MQIINAQSTKSDALIRSLKSKAEGDDGLVLLISENGSHITIPALLLLEAANKLRFSINKSLRDIRFCFCFKLFFRALLFEQIFGVVMSASSENMVSWH